MPAPRSRAFALPVALLAATGLLLVGCGGATASDGAAKASVAAPAATG